jgi:hypothetical protein
MMPIPEEGGQGAPPPPKISDSAPALAPYLSCANVQIRPVLVAANANIHVGKIGSHDSKGPIAKRFRLGIE